MVSLFFRQWRKLIESRNYRRWVKKYDCFSEERRATLQKKIDALDLFSLHKISVVMPVYNPPLRLLEEAIASVRSQIYPHWELCIVDDASTDAAVVTALQELGKKESRVKIKFLKKRSGIALTTNAALLLASGVFVAFLDHDDLLAPDALAEVALAIATVPDVGYLYSDEDKIDQRGRCSDPFFKPDWNPDLLTSLNYCSHLSVFRKSLLEELGALKHDMEGAQDWDLILRVTEKITPQQIIHLPKVLYHWRLSQNSTARSIKAKPHVTEASKKVLEQALQRRKRAFIDVKQVEAGGHWKVRYALPDKPPLVSIIIPTRNRLDLLQGCIESLRAKTNYPHYEILIADNDSSDAAVLNYYRGLEKEKNIRIIECHGSFNYSAINNQAVTCARGEILVLLNNDIEVIQPDWLAELVAQAVRPEVGAVGAVLRYPDGRIQHAGVVLGIGGVAGHVGKFFREQRYIGGNRMKVVQNFSAVTGACLAVRKKIYEEVGGLDEMRLAIAFNDVDFCLKLQQIGYWNVWTPFAELIHHESASRGSENTLEKKKRFAQEVATMREKWGALLNDDPAYNRNLTLVHEDWNLAWPPRRRK